MKLEINGLDKLNKMQKNLNKINGSKGVPLSELLTDEFLQEFSDFKSFNDMVDKSEYDIEEFGEKKEIDQFISLNSKFTSWEEMLSEASGQWALNQIMK